MWAEALPVRSMIASNHTSSALLTLSIEVIVVCMFFCVSITGNLCYCGVMLPHPFTIIWYVLAISKILIIFLAPKQNSRLMVHYIENDLLLNDCVEHYIKSILLYGDFRLVRFSPGIFSHFFDIQHPYSFYLLFLWLLFVYVLSIKFYVFFRVIII